MSRLFGHNNDGPRQHVPNIGNGQTQPAPPYRPDATGLVFEAGGHWVVATYDSEEMTSGGIIKPLSAQKSAWYRVLSVGMKVEGFDPPLQEGELVMARNRGEVMTEQGALLVIEDKDIACRVHREELVQVDVPFNEPARITVETGPGEGEDDGDPSQPPPGPSDNETDVSQDEVA